MVTELGLSKLTNHEVKIYIGTANEIFLKCFTNAGLQGPKLMPKMLEAAIDRTFADSRINADFLRNKYNTIKRLKKENNPELEIAFFHTSIYTLARFAGIEDYVAFNKNFRPHIISVLCAPGPFKMFDFLRMVEHGEIKQGNSNWKYTGDDGTAYHGEIKAIALYIMKGDRQPLWLKVDYLANETHNTLYFAEMENSLIIVQSKLSRLYKFFHQFLPE